MRMDVGRVGMCSNENFIVRIILPSKLAGNFMRGLRRDIFSYLEALGVMVKLNITDLLVLRLGGEELSHRRFGTAVLSGDETVTLRQKGFVFQAGVLNHAAQSESGLLFVGDVVNGRHVVAPPFAYRFRHS